MLVYELICLVLMCIPSPQLLVVTAVDCVLSSHTQLYNHQIHRSGTASNEFSHLVLLYRCYYWYGGILYCRLL